LTLPVSSLRAALLLEASIFTTAPTRAGRCTSPGVCSPTALDNRGRPYTPADSIPPAPSVHKGFSPFSTSYFALDPARSPPPLSRRNRRNCAPGVIPGLPRSPWPFGQCRAEATRVPSPRLSPPLASSTRRVLSRLAPSAPRSANRFTGPPTEVRRCCTVFSARGVGVFRFAKPDTNRPEVPGRTSHS